MEKRALLAAVLSVVVIMLWQYFFMPPLQSPEETASSTNEAIATARLEDDGATVRDEKSQTAPTGSGAPTSPGAVEDAGLVREERTLNGDVFKAVFTTEGGGIKSWELNDYPAYHKGKGPLDVLKGLIKQTPEERGTAKPMDVLAGPYENALPFALDSKLDSTARFRFVEVSPSRVQFERRQGNLLISKTYEMTQGEYLINMRVAVQNLTTSPVSLAPVIGVNGEYSVESSQRFVPSSTPIYYVEQKVERIDHGDLEKGYVQSTGLMGWAGASDKYFLRAVLPPAGSQGAVRVVPSNNRVFITELSSPAVTVPSGAVHEFAYSIFLGPKRSEILKKYDRDLQKSLDFGMFGVFAEPLLWLLKRLYSVTASYGLAIILLTLIIKMMFFPLMVKQLESAQKMKEVQPEMAALREKYKDDRNKLNQEMMRFMQENKINPLGGCLPMLLQMPIWFALYQVLQNSIELYHTPFLYLPDLSDQDPYGVSPLLLGIMMFVQQKMTPPAPGMDPAQARMMQYLPLIFSAIMFTLPSGLVVYILVNTILTIAQQWYITERSTGSSGKRGASRSRS